MRPSAALVANLSQPGGTAAATALSWANLDVSRLVALLSGGSAAQPGAAEWLRSDGACIAELHKQGAAARTASTKANAQ